MRPATHSVTSPAHGSLNRVFMPYAATAARGFAHDLTGQAP